MSKKTLQCTVAMRQAQHDQAERAARAAELERLARVARAALGQIYDFTEQREPLPAFDEETLWALARHSGDRIAWRVALIQLMVRAETDSRLWLPIGVYLTEEAPREQLDKDVLWRFLLKCPNGRLAGKMERLIWRIRRADRKRAQSQEQRIAA